MKRAVLNELEAHLEAAADPEAAAARAGLRYVQSDEPGFTRLPWGQGFTYRDPGGETVRDPELRARLERLVIPPAWTEVWICPWEDGHVLATGRDEAGRKQYIYHPEWERVRSEAKFSRMLLFGEALPLIRARCAEDLALDGLPRRRVLAVVATLLDRTHIRIGNHEYARRNGSFGLTTLRDRHVTFGGDGCTFEFTGKSGKKHCVQLNDPEMAALVRDCRDVPGYDLFQYYDEAGGKGTVGSGDVNAYLKDVTGQDFSAKDFRTWAGTVHAAVRLAEAGAPSDERTAQAQVVATVKDVAERLGNTPAVCRAYYIHPAVVSAYEAGTLPERWRRYARRKTREHLEPSESILLHFLHDEVLGKDEG